jgi:pimeloyl-ACP methyl ester carboxylesterase
MVRLLVVLALFGCGRRDRNARNREPLKSSPVVTSDPAVLAIPCDGSAADVYAAEPSGKPGEIVRCAVAAEKDRYRSYLLAYRTERAAGVPGVGTAMLYLPKAPTTKLVAATHGTVGLADRCAPSKMGTSDYIVLPWIDAGHAVIAPDYAGMGNAGTQGYGNTHDTAHSVLDSIRAAKRAVPSLTEKVIVEGHSQGGGAALAAQALARSYAPDVELGAIVGFAAGYVTTDASQAMRHPFAPIVNPVQRAVLALFVYAEHANLFGEKRARDAFAPPIRAHAGDAIEGECIYALAATLAKPARGYAVPRTLGALLAPAWREEVVACLDGDCTADAKAFVERARANVVPLDGDGAPILLLVGETDPQQSPAKQACLRDYARGAGLEAQTCIAAGADHSRVVGERMAFAVLWAQSVRDGKPAPACPSGPALPACAP